jgi:hypothetical protein
MNLKDMMGDSFSKFFDEPQHLPVVCECDECLQHHDAVESELAAWESEHDREVNRQIDEYKDEKYYQEL